MHFDLLIRNGHYFDDAGDLRAGGVGVVADRIVALGDIPEDATATKTIDATDRLISPGFIDIHTHSDLSAVCQPCCQSKLHQGVTTEVIGNCSLSAFPLNQAHRDQHRELMQVVSLHETSFDWTDLDGYARAVEAAAPALNIVPLVGHGALRIAAGLGGVAGPCPAHVRGGMSRLLAEAFEQGAFGFTTGLSIVPSCYADQEEVQELVNLTSAYDRMYATHIRASGVTELEAFNEAAATTRASGVRLQYSHLAINQPSNWGKGGEVLERFHKLRADGVDVAFDVYPYDASSSSLSQYLPSWVQAGGLEAMRERLRDPATRRQALADAGQSWWAVEGPWRWERFIVSAAPPQCHEMIGHSIAELADGHALSGEELALRLVEEFGNEVHVVLHYRDEADVVSFMRDDLAIIGSDGLALPARDDGSRVHPRSFGSFPRVLGRYVRDQAALTLAEAIRKMTSAPADRLKLRDRGRLTPGCFADITILDPSRVSDRATFTNPFELAEGVEVVVVNGAVALEAGAETGARSGRLLRYAA
ncbi:D-aminoacylase [Phenylobacterium hankyongense]|uniref:D-aminoacylase n=1 Tax=Phenylobacterium hankyongense TaxID=1813876 RepID=A0A328B049_9CAUL|nr:amidohydrolase family protein [Phenylobacterium hankyongense]RAK60762.1 D-aminoacylase [Phenylobacterium hankyongense]